MEEPSQRMQQLIEWLRGAVIDVAIMELPVPDLSVVPLLREELCAIVASSSPAAGAMHLSIKELAKQSFIMSRYSSGSFVLHTLATSSR